MADTYDAERLCEVSVVKRLIPSAHSILAKEIPRTYGVGEFNERDDLLARIAHGIFVESLRCKTAGYTKEQDLRDHFWVVVDSHREKTAPNGYVIDELVKAGYNVHCSLHIHIDCICKDNGKCKGKCPSRDYVRYTVILHQ